VREGEGERLLGAARSERSRPGKASDELHQIRSADHGAKQAARARQRTSAAATRKGGARAGTGRSGPKRSRR